jgi:mycothiol synthase
MQDRIKIRNFRWDDLPDLVDVFNLSAEADGDVYRWTLEELRHYLATPETDVETDGFVAVTPEGWVVAEADIEMEPEIGRCWSGCVVHPAFRGLGLGTNLIRATEARFMERGTAEIAPETPLFIQRAVISTNEAGIQLLRNEGYQPVRSFYTMQIDLNEPVDAPPLPNGLEIRPFDPERDAFAVYETHQEAFDDHWGSTRDTYEYWRFETVDSPKFIPSLWLTAWDGNQMAGVVMGRPFGEQNPETAWVGVLAVRRPWRRMGLGMALLKQSFANFQRHGYKRAGLGVDADSLTNAVALYERAGMNVELRRDVYRKIMRGTLP